MESLSNHIRRLTGPQPFGKIHNEPYVLYLRSFGSEYVTQRIPDQEDNLLRNLRNLLFSATFGATEEQRLAKALGAVGLGVALGKPGEPPPERGFRRLYITDDEWQPKVEKLMSKAQLVVLRIGNSAGLLWELEKARQILAAERLVILIPGDSDLISETVLSEDSEFKTVEMFPGLRLPVFSASNVHKTSIAGVISFDADWTAHGVPLSVDTYSFKHALEVALDPIFIRLNIHLRLRRLYRLPPPFMVYSSLLLGAIMLAAAVMVRLSQDFFYAPALPSIQMPEPILVDLEDNSEKLRKINEDFDRAAKAEKELDKMAKESEEFAWRIKLISRSIDSRRAVVKNRGRRRGRRK